MLPLLGVVGGESLIPGWELRSHRLCGVTREKTTQKKKKKTVLIISQLPKAGCMLARGPWSRALEHRPLSFILFGCRKASAFLVHVAEKHDQGPRVGPRVKETDFQVLTALAF